MSTHTKSSKGSNEVVLEIEADKFPKLQEHDHVLLRRILQGSKTGLEFNDYLKTFSLSGEEIGDFTINVKQLIYKNLDCFHIIAKSAGKIDNVPCGTEINAYVTAGLETIEQELHEFIKLENNPLNRRTTIVKENDVNYKITQISYTANKPTTKNYSVLNSLMIGFISEAANLLLQRLIIQQGFSEKLTLYTLDSNMIPCLVHYKPLDKRNIYIKEENFDIIGIERHIEAISDLPTTWQIYFANDGHMINRVQIGAPAVMKAVEPPKSIELDEFLQFPTFGKKELNWETDIELKSKQIDREEELKNEYNQYLEDHPELKLLLGDFLQSVLTIKPDDIIKHSAQFFGPFSSKPAKNRLFPATNKPQNIPKH